MYANAGKKVKTSAVKRADLLKILKESFHHQQFRSDVQCKAIETICKGNQDVFISMPSGAGKSLCFQLPAVYLGGVTIVISPSLAHMQDQLRHMEMLNISAGTLNSNLTKKSVEGLLQDLSSGSSKIVLLYATPGEALRERFIKIIEKLLSKQLLSLLVVDEAHCVSQCSHAFSPGYLKLKNLRKKIPNVPCVALTATSEVNKDIITLLHLRQPIASFRSDVFRSNLYYSIKYKDILKDPYLDLKEFALKSLGEKRADGKFDGCGIVYCRMNADCTLVASELCQRGLMAKPYHSGLREDKLIETHDEWMRGTITIIVAVSSRFGLGVDKGTVRFVAHWTIPESMANYYQESGRAGRDGKLAYCRMYYSRLDRERFGARSRNGIKQKLNEESYGQYHAIVKYCEDLKCRHRAISTSVGQNAPACKAMCDHCDDLDALKRHHDEFRKVRGISGDDLSNRDGSNHRVISSKMTKDATRKQSAFMKKGEVPTEKKQKCNTRITLMSPESTRIADCGRGIRQGCFNRLQCTLSYNHRVFHGRKSSSKSFRTGQQESDDAKDYDHQSEEFVQSTAKKRKRPNKRKRGIHIFTSSGLSNITKEIVQTAPRLLDGNTSRMMPGCEPTTSKYVEAEAGNSTESRKSSGHGKIMTAVPQALIDLTSLDSDLSDCVTEENENFTMSYLANSKKMTVKSEKNDDKHLDLSSDGDDPIFVSEYNRYKTGPMISLVDDGDEDEVSKTSVQPENVYVEIIKEHMQVPCPATSSNFSEACIDRRYANHIVQPTKGINVDAPGLMEQEKSSVACGDEPMPALTGSGNNRLDSILKSSAPEIDKAVVSQPNMVTRTSNMASFAEETNSSISNDCHTAPIIPINNNIGPKSILKTLTSMTSEVDVPSVYNLDRSCANFVQRTRPSASACHMSSKRAAESQNVTTSELASKESSPDFSKPSYIATCPIEIADPGLTWNEKIPCVRTPQTNSSSNEYSDNDTHLHTNSSCSDIDKRLNVGRQFALSERGGGMNEKSSNESFYDRVSAIVVRYLSFYYHESLVPNKEVFKMFAKNLTEYLTQEDSIRDIHVMDGKNLVKDILCEFFWNASLQPGKEDMKLLKDTCSRYVSKYLAGDK